MPEKRHVIAALVLLLAVGIVFAGGKMTKAEAAAEGALLPPGTEIIELRDEYSKHYSKGDGTVKAEIYAEPIHRLDEYGNWAPIVETDVITNVYPNNTYRWSGYIRNGSYLYEDNLRWGYYYGSRYRGFCKFNLSPIMDGSTITDSDLRFYVYYERNVSTDIRLVTSDPVTASIATIYSQAGSGTLFGNIYVSTTGWKTLDLGSSGDAAIGARLAQDWIALGWNYRYSSNSYARCRGRSSSSRPYIIVDYNLPSYPRDAGVARIIAPVGDQLVGTIIPQAWVENYGTTAQSFNVRMDIGTGYTNTQSVPSLAPGDSWQVSFASWSATCGIYPVMCTTMLTGDQYNGNDFLDEVTVIFNWIEYLDSDSANYTADPSSGGWDWGAPASPRPTPPSTPNVWGAPLSGYYVNNANWKLVSATYVATQDNPVIAFQQWFSFETRYDGGNVCYSTDGGSNWTVIEPWALYSRPYYGTVYGLGERGYSGRITAWEPTYFQIPVLNGASFQVRWRVGSDNSVNWYYGWSIDDIGGICCRKVHDVAATTIIQPTGTVNYGAAVAPRAVVRNLGGFTETFDVDFTIADGYTNTQTVTSLPPGGVDTITFATWTANTPGTWATKCSTKLSNDDIPSNDSITGRVFVRLYDVQPTEILAPVGQVLPGAVITPEVIVRNNGSQAASFYADLYIGADPARTRIVVNLPSLAVDTIQFSSWTAGAPGKYAVRCTTRYSADAIPSNDQFVDTVEVLHIDIGAVSIVVPSGVYLPGTIITPEGKWHNYGSVPTNFEAWMILGDPTDSDGDNPIDAEVYRQKVDVTGLAPGLDTNITFPNHNLNTSGLWTSRCSAYAVADQDLSNDTVNGDFIVGSPDIGVVKLLAPTGRVDTGKVVTPKATVHNYGNVDVPFRTWFVMNDPTDAEVYREFVDVPGLGVGGETDVTFPDHNVGINEGDWTTRCSVYVAGDVNTSNDYLDGSFSVSARLPGPPGWHEVAPMPLPTSGRPVKRGGWLAFNEDDGYVYAAKGYKTTDFYRYDPMGDSWTGLTGMPYQTHTNPKWAKKVPRKGSKGASDGGNHIYVTQGNNTLGFWKYFVDGDSWKELSDVPFGPYRKKVKGGTDLAYVPGEGDDDDYVYLLKGYKTEFYRYNVATSKWDTLPEAPIGARKKWDKGSWLVFNEADGTDDAKLLYAHKAKYYTGTDHEMWKYNIAGDSWSDKKLKGMPLWGLHSGRLKKKKSKDGGSGAWYESEIYALKGGNTQQFFKYTAAKDSWTELDTVPNYTATTGRKRRVKYGADIVSHGTGAFFALKGNKTREMWRYLIPLPLADLPERSGVMAGFVKPDRFGLTIAPNPLSTGFVTLRYALPKAGPAQISIFDVAGRVQSRQMVLARRSGAVSLDLRKLSAGVYLVRFDANDFSATRKLVVQH